MFSFILGIVWVSFRKIVGFGGRFCLGFVLRFIFLDWLREAGYWISRMAGWFLGFGSTVCVLFFGYMVLVIRKGVGFLFWEFRFRGVMWF